MPKLNLGQHLSLLLTSVDDYLRVQGWFIKLPRLFTNARARQQLVKYSGNIQKMRVELADPVRYYLPVGEHEVFLNPLIGESISLRFTGTINCIACGRETNKSFNQGHCFPCLRSLARCDTCIVRPELCHFEKGTCREPEWGAQNCNQKHIVYLANSSGLKVGITRGSQIPTRWIDQGASQALPILEVPDRLTAGLVEVAIKSSVSDRTNWRKMLKGSPEPVDLLAERDRLLAESAAGLDNVQESIGSKSMTRVKEQVIGINYPVDRFPEKVKSINLDKNPEIVDRLTGIKGQYLIFESGVINMRKYAGYKLVVADA